MKILNYIIVILFVFTTHSVVSQNPGYQGKKFILSAGVSGMPFSGSMLVNEDAFDFNLRNTLRLEYVARPDFAFGLSYEKVNDIITLTNFSVSNLTPLAELSGSEWAKSPAEFESAAFFKGNNYGVFGKFYNRENFGSLAPLGSYFVMEMYLNDIKIFDDGRYYNNEQTQIHRIKTQTIVFGAGIQNIFFNHVTFDISFNIGLNTVGVNAIRSYSAYVGAGGNAIFKEPESKMFSDYIVFSRISIGWLLF